MFSTFNPRPAFGAFYLTSCKVCLHPLSLLVESNADIFSWLLDIVEQDPVPSVRHRLFQMLIDNPPFKHRETSALNNEGLVERLWTLMK